MLSRARDNNIQSFTYIWLHKGNQNEFLKYPKIEWSDGGLEPPNSGLPVDCSTTWANLTNFRMLLIAYMNVACFIMMLQFNYDVITSQRLVIFKVLRTSGFIKKIRTNSLSIRKLNG